MIIELTTQNKIFQWKPVIPQFNNAISDLVMISGITKPDNLQCENGWIRNDDFNACYCLSKRHASWDNAQVTCQLFKFLHKEVYYTKELLVKVLVLFM